MTRFFIRFYNTIQKTIRGLSPLEQLIVMASYIIVSVFIFSLFFQWSHRITHLWPQNGGTLHEGALGTPRFIHPLYAKSNSERDLVALTFSGLMRETEDGVFIPDLAKSYTRSDDNTTYTFTLRDEITFHDGQPIDADDVVFTYTQAQTLTESPNLMSQWQGITPTKIDDRTVKIVLDKPFADFIDQTTLGIIPQHIWYELADEVVFSQYMIQPIGSGPFVVTHIDSDKEGFPTDFKLRRFKKFALGSPYLRQITYTIFETPEELYRAFENHTITSFVDDYTDVRIGSHSESASSMKLNRLFGLFVANKSTSPVKNPTVLHALAYFIDRDAIIDATMSGYATPRIGVLDMSFDDLGEPVVFNPNKGYQILADAGWTLDKKTGMLVSSLETSSDQFSFTLATSNAPHLIAIAEYLQQSLGTYGIKVTLDIYTSDVLLEEIIPKRSFDVLLFGVSIPFPGSISSYWHSSQRNDPGRNITQYTNAGTDKILEQAHSEHNLEKRIDMYNEFNRQISTDQPALMLYAPNIIYETPKKLHHSLPAVIDTPKERFNMIHTWFIHKTQVWSWFNQKNKRTL